MGTTSKKVRAPLDSHGWKLVEISLWTSSLSIGAMQMMRLQAGILTAQGADLTAPALLYFLTRRGKTYLRYIGLTPQRPMRVAAGLLVLCCGWELLQKAGLIPGVFDWFDLLAYAIGLAGAFALDQFLTHRK